MEFLFLISFLFVFSLAFIIAAGIQLKNFSDNNKIELVVDFGESLTREINLASIVNEGYERTIILPDKIDDSIEYTIEMNGSTIIVNTDYYEFSDIISKTNGELKKGNNTI